MAESISVPGESTGNAIENPATTSTQAPKVKIFSQKVLKKRENYELNHFLGKRNTDATDSLSQNKTIRLLLVLVAIW